MQHANIARALAIAAGRVCRPGPVPHQSSCHAPLLPLIMPPQAGARFMGIRVMPSAAIRRQGQRMPKVSAPSLQARLAGRFGAAGGEQSYMLTPAAAHSKTPALPGGKTAFKIARRSVGAPSHTLTPAARRRSPPASPPPPPNLSPKRSRSRRGPAALRRAAAGPGVVGPCVASAARRAREATSERRSLRRGATRRPGRGSHTRRAPPRGRRNGHTERRARARPLAPSHADSDSVRDFPRQTA